MADNLVKLMDETGYRQLINMLISIKSSQQEDAEKCISVWQPNTMYQKDKVVLVVNNNTYSEYICKATHVSAEMFDEAYWTLVSCVEFEGYTEEELLAMLNLSQEELNNLQNLINNDEVQNNHVWSSSKVYAELLTVLSESKNFTIAEIAKIVSFSYKVVTSEDDVVDDKAIYLIENAITGTYDMYLLVDGSPSKVGNTNINLDGYVKKENIIDTFDGTATYTDNDKVFSTKASKSMYDDLNDKKISKSNIVTTLDDTVTDEQIVGAKAVYELTKDKNLKTYTDFADLGIDRTNFTLEEVATKLIDTSALMVGINNQTPKIFPKTFGHFMALRKSNDKVKFFFFPNEDNEANTIYFCGYHPITGVTEWEKVCTTRVPDVPVTEITSFKDTNVKSFGASSYYVENGWCHLVLEIQFAEDAVYGWNNIIDTTVYNIPIPKMKSGSTKMVLSNNGVTSRTIVVAPQGGGLVLYAHVSRGEQFFGSVTYPVAEDWRP